MFDSLTTIKRAVDDWRKQQRDIAEHHIEQKMGETFRNPTVNMQFFRWGYYPLFLIILHLEYETYNFDRNWETCDYIDPSKLSGHVGKNDLLIVQWNTRGLRGKLDDIESLLNHTLEQKVGIVIINESWVTNNSPTLTQDKWVQVYRKSEGK